MRPHDNPYTPNAGARPPALVGRDTQLTAFEILLDRLRKGRTGESMLITGLRGVGKTVLLGALEERAKSRGWTTIEAEITKNVAFGPRMAQLARRALLQVAPRARWKDRGARAAAVPKSFQVDRLARRLCHLRARCRCCRRSRGQRQPERRPHSTCLSAWAKPRRSRMAVSCSCSTSAVPDDRRTRGTHRRTS